MRSNKLALFHIFGWMYAKCLMLPKSKFPAWEMHLGKCSHKKSATERIKWEMISSNWQSNWQSTSAWRNHSRYAYDIDHNTFVCLIESSQDWRHGKAKSKKRNVQVTTNHRSICVSMVYAEWATQNNNIQHIYVSYWYARSQLLLLINYVCVCVSIHTEYPLITFYFLSRQSSFYIFFSRSTTPPLSPTHSLCFSFFRSSYRFLYPIGVAIGFFRRLSCIYYLSLYLIFFRRRRRVFWR